jgi:flagellar hook-length control protein FliK
MLIEADAEPVLPSPRPVADAKVRSQKELVQLVEVESESPAIMINKDAPDEPSLSPAPENQPLASAEEEALLAKPVKTAQPQNQAASSEEFPIRQDPLLTRKLFQAQDDAARDVGRTASSPALPPAARRPGLSELTVRPTFSEEFSLSLKRRPETMKITARDVEQAVSLLQLPPSAHREVTSRLTACSTFSAENPDSGAAAPAQPPSQNNETETETGNRAVMHHQPPTEPRPTRPLGARPTETSHSWSGAGLAENAKSSQSQTPGSPAAFEAPALGRHRQNDQEPAPIDPPSSDALPAPLSLETAQAQNAPSAASLTARASEIIRQTIEPVVVAASGLERREARAFSLHLHPAELGEVEVKLTRDDDGRLNAHLTAQQETARDALADGLSQLRESLERAGLAINQLDVNLSSHSGPGTSAHAGDGQARSSLPHFGPATLAPESADAPLDVEQDRLLSLRA